MSFKTSFIMIESKIREMNLSVYERVLYDEIVFHARNSKIGHIESQEKTAKNLGCSKRQIIRSLKILTDKNIVKIEKYGKNKNRICLVDQSFWIFSSDSQSHQNSLVVTHSHTSSDSQSQHSHTLELTRSSLTIYIEKNEKILSTIAFELSLSIKKIFNLKFYSYEKCLDILKQLLEKGLSIDDIKLSISDIIEYSYLTNVKLIFQEIENWLKIKQDFILQQQNENVSHEFIKKERELMQKPAKFERKQILSSIDTSELPIELKSWIETLDRIQKKNVLYEIKKTGLKMFLDDMWPQIQKRNNKQHLKVI